MPAPFAPTFAGFDLFGPAPECDVDENPVGRMTTAFPGVVGLQTTMMGGRGGQARITGVLFGQDTATLIAAIATIRAYHQDGGVYPFTGPEGDFYSQAVMGPLRLTSGLLPWDSTFGYGRRFEVTVLILR
jgi:hypothetical protein